MGPVQLDPGTLAAWREAGTTAVLDVREPWELAIVRFPEALDIPLGQLQQRWDEVPQDRPVVVVCHHGMRSLQATMFLRSQGVAEAYNLSGGIDGYAASIDPSLARY